MLPGTPRSPPGPPISMAAYGESLAILERVVVVPVVGRFYPTEFAGREAGSGTRIQCGQAIGQVDSQRVSTPVRSPFESRLMGMLAVAGGTSSQANRSLGCWSAAARPALDDHWKGVIAVPEPAAHPCRCST